MEKRGLSAIVATVVIILVTIAAVTIVWAVIVPLINQGATFDDVNTRLDIVKSSGYTFYDEQNEKLYVQVKRGIDESDMVGMDIILKIEGNTQTYTYNGTYVPGPNQAKSIVINLTGYPLPEEIKVVPIVYDGGKVKRSSVTSQVTPQSADANVDLPPTPVSERDLSIPAECTESDLSKCNVGEVCFNEECCTPASCPAADTICDGITDTMTPRGCGLSNCSVTGTKTASCTAANTVPCGTPIVSSNGCGTCSSGTNCTNWYDECVAGSCVLKPTTTLYQENANSYVCAGAWNVTYPCLNVYDGNWNTFGYGGSIYINYTKPANLLSSRNYWNISISSAWDQFLPQNISIEISGYCLNHSNILQLRIDSTIKSLGGHFDSYCWNGTDWNNLFQVYPWGPVEVREEAMVWNVTAY